MANILDSSLLNLVKDMWHNIYLVFSGAASSDSTETLTNIDETLMETTEKSKENV